MSSPPRTYLAAAALCGLLSAYLVWLAAANPRGLLVPPSITLLAGAALALAGARLLQLHRRPDSQGHGYAALIFAVFAVIGGWIALSPDSQACTVGIDDAPIGETAGAGCRVPFGVGAIITSALALYAGWMWSRRRAAN